MLFKFKPLEKFLRKYRSKFFLKYVFIGYINIFNPGTTENMNFKLRKSREIFRYLFQMSQSSSSFQVGGINGYFYIPIGFRLQFLIVFIILLYRLKASSYFSIR